MANEKEPGISLIVYLDERFRMHDQLHAEQAKAVLVAVDSMNQRLVAVNELREDIQEMSAKMVSRDYYEDRHTDIDKRLQQLERQSATKAALEAANSEVAKMRRNLVYTVTGGLILILADIILAALKK